MDIEQILRERRSRRRFLQIAGVGMAGSSAVLLGACGDDDDDDEGSASEPGTGAAENPDGDVTILNAALDLELEAIEAYTAGAALLEGAALEAGKKFLEHEMEHAEGLKTAIEQAGGTPNEKKDSYDFPELSNQEDVLRFAIDLENNAIAAYIEVLPMLSTGELRATAASIVSNEAEHISVLLGALGEEQIPDAFVTGKKS